MSKSRSVDRPEPGPDSGLFDSELLAAINSQRSWMVELLVDLMAISSSRGQEGPAQSRIEAALNDIGLDHERQEFEQSPPDPSKDRSSRYNVISEWRPVVSSGRSLVLGGHIDILEPPSNALRSRSPFEPTVESGVILGWGGLKAGLVSMLGALRAISQLELEPSSLLRFQSVIEEETSGNGAVAAASSLCRLDAAVVAGSVGDTISTQQVGAIWVEICVTVPPRHAPGGVQTKSAIELAIALTDIARAVSDELARNPPEAFAPIANPLAFNLGAIHGGTAPSLSPGKCTVRVRTGVFPRVDSREVFAHIESRIQDYCRTDPVLRRYPPQVRLADFVAQGYEMDDDEPIFQAVVSAHERLGIRPHIAPSTTATDTRAFIAHGIPAICVGPKVEDLHGITERIEISSLSLAAKKVGLIISTWTGLQPRKSM